MLIYVLLFIEIIILLLCYKINKYNILSLSFVSIFGFIVSHVAALYSLELWDLELSGFTFFTIIIGLITMIFAEALSKKVSFIGYKKNKIDYLEEHLAVKDVTWFVCGIILILCTFVYYREVLNVGMQVGIQGLDAVSFVKSEANEADGLKMNFLIRQFFKIVMAISYVFIYIFVYNLIVNKKKNLSMIVLPTICSVLITIFSGARTEILRILSAAIFDYLVVSYIYKRKNISISSTFFKFAPLFLGLGVIAFATKSIVKLSNVETSKMDSFMGYVSYYIGSPISVMNTKIDFKEYGLDYFYGNSNFVPEFVYLGSLNYGGNVGSILNVATFEYGIVGMVSYIFIIYFIFGYILHHQILESTNHKGIHFKVILFSFSFFIFTMAYYSDCLGLLIGQTGLLTMLAIYFVFKFSIRTFMQ